MGLLDAGEKVLVVERRAFDGDVRRHFVGEVEYATDATCRATGYTFVCNPGTGNFDRREPARTRLLPLADANLVLYVLPREIDLRAIRYEGSVGTRLSVRAGDWVLSLDEFGAGGR